ncbi:hypothetical protein MTO96_033071 [Rhipicephalus appendiculatus]
MAATEALHERILDQNKPQEPQEDEHENLVQEVKKLKKDLKAARQQNKRLTDALLDNIEIARAEGLKRDSGATASTSIGSQTDAVEFPQTVANQAPAVQQTADETEPPSLFDEAYFLPDSYNDDLRLLSEFSIPAKKPRLRPDAVPSVFSHRPILQAKCRGAFEKQP